MASIIMTPVNRRTVRRLYSQQFSAKCHFHGYSAVHPLMLLGISVRESLRALVDPHLRGDSVAAVGEATGETALISLYESMRKDSVGRRILENVGFFRSLFKGFLILDCFLSVLCWAQIILIFLCFSPYQTLHLEVHTLETCRCMGLVLEFVHQFD